MKMHDVTNYNHIVFLCVLNIQMSTFCFGILDLWNVNFMRCTSSHLKWSFGKATTGMVRMSWTIFLVNFLLVQNNYKYVIPRLDN